jgi:hypothetical protein
MVELNGFTVPDLKSFELGAITHLDDPPAWGGSGGSATVPDTSFSALAAFFDGRAAIFSGSELMKFVTLFDAGGSSPSPSSTALIHASVGGSSSQ